MTEAQYLTLARHAYWAYAVYRKTVGYSPEPLVSFDVLTREAQIAWKEAVKATLAHAPFVAAGQEMP
jgi:hypothetical protein